MEVISGAGRKSRRGRTSYNQQPKKDKQNAQYPKPNKATTYAANSAKRGKPQYARGASNANSRGGAKKPQ